jgi:hypothetical protein
MLEIRTVLTPAACLGHLMAILAMGCTGVSQAPPSAPPPTSSAPEVTAKSPEQRPAATQPSEPVVAKQAAPSVPQPPSPALTQQPVPGVAVPAPAESGAVTSPDTTRPAASPGSRVPAASPDKLTGSTATAPKPSSAAPQKPAGPPPLDLKSLETRLKETKAIGVYTKLTLKNQVDDLLDDFRAYYKGQLKTTLAELRQAFDRLVLKVLALLQDADPQLASAIAGSREAIWGILSDPVKFAAV